ncbi:aminotransferase class IV [Belliella kenyensis]|uniref:branched-chain-amino-acid transaminase n=1 Tax=Belliella kenyensis TaxID=1472724 RepID=A0ABV8EHY1_9BACT|nr:aminotransferase class IV [Belliella kenyensis]MCH7400972.1 aminotransferase class IV [Belliella kenyensis]MDN3603970.1 aminotransferase class IV [Belliella kenyensis]
MNVSDTVILSKLKSSFWESTSFQVANRGLLYADGIFETMIFHNGKFRFREFHQERVLEGCEALGLRKDSLSSFEQLEVLLTNKWSHSDPCRVRWTIFRKSGGKYAPLCDEVEELLQLEAYYPSSKSKKSAFVHPTIKLHESMFSSCKTINALPYVIANRDRQLQGFEEVLLLDHRGYLSEAGAANLFWQTGGKFYTPSLSNGCINGVGRRVILSHMKSKHIPYEEVDATLESLYAADTVFVSNVTGISYLHQVGNRLLKQSKVAFLEHLFDF